MHVKIVTTQGTVVNQQDIVSVTLPTSTGEVTVKDDHIPLLSNITSGVISLVNDKNEESYLSISKGVLDVRRESQVTILADTAERAEDIDIDRALEAKKKAEEYLQNTQNQADVDFTALQAQIQKQLARVEAGKKWKKL